MFLQSLSAFVYGNSAKAARRAMMYQLRIWLESQLARSSPMLSLMMIDVQRAIACAITRLLLSVLFLGGTVVTARAADNTHIPPIALVTEIQLVIYPAWFLSIAVDGAGSIGYGSSASDFASVPAGTFDFQKIYSSLAQTVRVSGNMRESISIAFRQRNVTTTSARYTDDADLVLDLFNTAKQNAVGLNEARINELWERSPPSRDHFDYRRLIAVIAGDIEGLKETYPQLEDFAVAKHLRADRHEIWYSYHTHEPSRHGGWTSGVPNPDADGIWFHIDFHDPDSNSQLHTQPVTVAPHCMGNMRVFFLSLEGAKTKSINGAIWGILKKHGARACDQQPH